MDELVSQCTDLARLVMLANPDLSPWHDWTVELGVLLPHQTDWSVHRIRFVDLKGCAKERKP